ncbi:Protein of unknown function [Propionibacterium freudenreichii]|nr:hypothetical protein [Propionibacterium freudenreichii]CEI26874.1 Protein of unknown function [Propionibacterium freudenreichii]
MVRHLSDGRAGIAHGDSHGGLVEHLDVILGVPESHDSTCLQAQHRCGPAHADGLVDPGILELEQGVGGPDPRGARRIGELRPAFDTGHVPCVAHDMQLGARLVERGDEPGIHGGPYASGLGQRIEQSIVMRRHIGSVDDHREVHRQVGVDRHDVAEDLGAHQVVTLHLAGAQVCHVGAIHAHRDVDEPGQAPQVEQGLQRPQVTSAGRAEVDSAAAQGINCRKGA